MLSFFHQDSDEKGQGLVEYAFILVLVAIVVIAILLLLGPAVSQVYYKVANGLQPGSIGAIKTVTTARTGPGNSRKDVAVTVTVKKSTSVTVSDSQSGQAAPPITCNGSCAVTISDVGDNSGAMTVTENGGGIFSAPYEAK